MPKVVCFDFLYLPSDILVTGMVTTTARLITPGWLVHYHSQAGSPHEAGDGDDDGNGDDWNGDDYDGEDD